MTNFSKIGFIMATLGSSIGLGHIWRFPTMAGQNGGSAFILLFFVISVVIGVSMVVAEMLIGNRTNKNAQDAFYQLDESSHKKWHYVSFTIIGGPLILTFYCIVLAWVIYYLVYISFHLPPDMDTSKEIFGALTQNFLAQWVCFAIVIALTCYFVSQGVKSGIERLNFILMPLLFIVFIGLLIYAMTLPHFKESVNFMFALDFTKITPKVLVDAMGQVFFSLSLGVCIIVTYSASTQKDQNLFSAALWILIPGIIISIIAGLMIFTFIFEYGSRGDVDEGVGLIFIALPVMFHKMGLLGSILCVFFMIGLGFAGLSSTISLLEPAVKWLEDKGKQSRTYWSYSIGLAIFIVGTILILSLNEGYKDYLVLAGQNLFEWASWISANVIMTFGGILTAIFVGYAIKKEHLREWTRHYFTPAMFSFWLFCIRVLAPVMVIAIFSYNVYDLVHKKEEKKIEKSQEKQQ